MGESAATPELSQAGGLGGWLASSSNAPSPSQPAQLRLREPRPLSHCSIIPVLRVCRQIILTYPVGRPLLCLLPLHLHPLISPSSSYYGHTGRFPSPSAPSPTARGDLTSSKSPDPCRRSPSRPCRQLQYFGNILGNSLGLLLLLTYSAFLHTPFTRLCCKCSAILREKQQQQQ